jgi:hypothetical protein
MQTCGTCAHSASQTGSPAYEYIAEAHKLVNAVVGSVHHACEGSCEPELLLEQKLLLLPLELLLQTAPSSHDLTLGWKHASSQAVLDHDQRVREREVERL